MKDFLISIGALLAVMLLCFGFVYFMESTSCHTKWDSQYEPKYGLFSDCQIKVDGKYIPASAFKFVKG